MEEPTIEPVNGHEDSSPSPIAAASRTIVSEAQLQNDAVQQKPINAGAPNTQSKTDMGAGERQDSLKMSTGEPDQDAGTYSTGQDEIRSFQNIPLIVKGSDSKNVGTSRSSEVPEGNQGTHSGSPDSSTTRRDTHREAPSTALGLGGEEPEQRRGSEVRLPRIHSHSSQGSRAGSERSLASTSQRKSSTSRTADLRRLGSSGSSRGQAEASERPVPRRQNPRTSRSRSNRELILPRWQPDAEVTYCPICSTQFSFFVRKHHCRKCGRVVCNACSPHRITIPYPYIVQPPPVVSGTGVAVESDASSELQGGMKVRLCNPCVPDPNTAPPRSPPNNEWRRDAPPTYYLNAGDRPYSFDENSMNNLERDTSVLTALRERDPSAARARGMSAASVLAPAQRRQHRSEQDHASHLVNSSSYSGTTTPSMHPGSRLIPRVDGQNPRQPYHALSTSTRPIGHTRQHQSMSAASGNGSNLQPHYRSLLNPEERPLPPVPRIAEEDECPICHQELPSRSAPNFEDARAIHVMQCIDQQIAAHSRHATRPPVQSSASISGPIVGLPPGPPPVASTATSSSPDQPNVTPQAPSSSRTQPAIPAAPDLPGSVTATTPIPPNLITSFPTIANTPEARTAARERAHAAIVLGTSQPRDASSSSAAAARRTAMFPYRATEKDCVDSAECTICLEEFEVGVAMARLECLCRFHRQCIRDWFVGHPGMCPVHSHDGYGF